MREESSALIRGTGKVIFGRRTVALFAILMMGLMGCGELAAQPGERDAKLTETIPKAMQQASVPGAIVGIWQDGRAPYVRAFGVRARRRRREGLRPVARLLHRAEHPET